MAARDLARSDFCDPSSPPQQQSPTMARDLNDDAYIAELLKNPEAFRAFLQITQYYNKVCQW